MKESALPASQALAILDSEGLGAPWADPRPVAGGAAAGASCELLEQLVRIRGRESAAKDAEDAFTKLLLESLIFFMAVLLMKSCHKDINYKPLFRNLQKIMAP